MNSLTKELPPFLSHTSLTGLSADSPLTKGVLPIITQTAQRGIPFGIHRVPGGGLDLAKIKGSPDKTLGSLIAENYPDDAYGTALIRYFLANYACYVEIPLTRVRNGLRLQAYDKFIATTSLEVISSWTSLDLEEVALKYGSRVDYAEATEGTDETPYVKLYINKAGTPSVTRPRSDLDISQKGMRVVPIDFLSHYMKYLVSQMQESLISVDFEKDNGTIRTLPTTLNRGILEEIYGKGDYVDNALKDSFSGDWSNLGTLNRGYIKVPEVGSSIYDFPTRSINFSRIRKVDYDPSVDLSFVEVDISAVLDTFISRITKNASNTTFFEKVVEGLKIFNFNAKDVAPSVSSLTDWATLQNTILSTSFQRDLHSFMASTPNLFPGYSGRREETPFEVGNTFGGMTSLGLI